MKKKKIIKVILIIVMLLTALVAVIVDLAFQPTINIKINLINEKMFEFIAVLTSFWVTCYLLFFELYKDRYQLKMISKKYVPKKMTELMLIVYIMILGCCALVFESMILLNIVFFLQSWIGIIYIFYNTLKIRKSLMFNNYIDDYCKEISAKLENKENPINEEVFSELGEVLEECIVKEEYYCAQTICERLGEDVFDKLLENSIAIKNSSDDEDVDKTFKDIVGFGLYQINLIEDIKSEILIDRILNVQKKNIKKCIDAGQYDWFKIYIKAIIDQTFLAQKDKQSLVAKKTYVIYAYILKKLIKDNKNEWYEFLMNTLYSATCSLNFMFNNKDFKDYVKLISFGIGDKNKEANEFLLDNLGKCTEFSVSLGIPFCDLKVYYFKVFGTIKKLNDSEQMEKYLKILFEDCYKNSNEPEWLDFKMYCLKEILEEKNGYTFENTENFYFELLNEIIIAGEKYEGYVDLDRIRKQLLDNINQSEKLEEICDVIARILIRCILNNNIRIFCIILELLEEIMINTEKKDKILQKAVLNIYIDLMEYTYEKKDSKYISVCFRSLENVINNMDDKKIISNDLATSLIDKLFEVARIQVSENTNITNNVLEIFRLLLNENNSKYFIINNKENMTLLCRRVFNVATACIEDNYEDGVRSCSNLLGWYTIWAIKQANKELSDYLINLARELYKLSKDMDVSKKTQVFILTLFTTVGMYCCEDSLNRHYLDNIITILAGENEEMIFTAIRLRTFENNMWDCLMKDVNQNARKFKDEYFKKKTITAKNATNVKLGNCS